MINGLILLAAASMAAPTVQAQYCYYNDFNQYVCNGLSNGARIGIGIAIFVASIFFIILATMMRRRRIAAANKAYITQPAQGQGFHPQGGYGYNGQPQQQYGQPTPWHGNQTQYPPQAYQQSREASYAPPPGAPPPGQQPYIPENPPQYSPYSAPQAPPPGKGGSVV